MLVVVESAPSQAQSTARADEQPSSVEIEITPLHDGVEHEDVMDEGFEPPPSRRRVVMQWIASGFIAGTMLGGVALGGVLLHRELTRAERRPLAISSLPPEPSTVTPAAAQTMPAEQDAGEAVTAPQIAANAEPTTSDGATTSEAQATATKPLSDPSVADAATSSETTSETASTEGDPAREEGSHPHSGWSGTALGSGRTLLQTAVALGLDSRTAVLVGQALAPRVDLRSLKATDRLAMDASSGGPPARLLFQQSAEARWEIVRNARGLYEAHPWQGDAPSVAWQHESHATENVAAAATAGASPFRVTQAGPVMGYVDGRPMQLHVVILEGFPIEDHTARAYTRMRDAALRDGVHIRVVSGFRTMEHQQSLYAAYRAGRGNLAAKPGHSNHQSGHALDLNTAATGVYPWMQRNAARFGFRRTVPTEPWHWEYYP